MIAALYDIHANLPALEAVLDELGGLAIERIVVGGDVLPGPMPRETLDRLLSLDRPVEFIRGNGEVAVLAAMSGGEPPYRMPPQAQAIVDWTAAQLTEADRRLLETWPMTTRVNAAEKEAVLFCHATPRDENEIFTSETPAGQLAHIFDAAAAPLVVCGHTHMQFDRTIAATRVVNAGSVGMPFGEPGAYWLLLGNDVALRRTMFDLQAGADRIRATAYPQAAEFAEGNVLTPPAARAMLDLFGRRR